MSFGQPGLRKEQVINKPNFSSQRRFIRLHFPPNGCASCVNDKCYKKSVYKESIEAQNECKCNFTVKLFEWSVRLEKCWINAVHLPFFSTENLSPHRADPVGQGLWFHSNTAIKCVFVRRGNTFQDGHNLSNVFVMKHMHPFISPEFWHLTGGVNSCCLIAVNCWLLTDRYGPCDGPTGPLKQTSK